MSPLDLLRRMGAKSIKETKCGCIVATIPGKECTATITIYESEKMVMREVDLHGDGGIKV